MSIYARMMGLTDPTGGGVTEPGEPIPIHTFFATMQEYMLGLVTGAQAIALFGLNAAEQAEATALRDRLLAEPSTTNGIQRRLKGIELENVVSLAQHSVGSGIAGAPYTTEASVRARLGVP
jgi:hypothetical protein